MKNKLLPLVNKLLPEKRVLIKTINDQLKNLTQLEYHRQRRVFSFLIWLLLGLIASTLFACYVTTGAVSETSYRTSWIGNTFGGGSKWVQNFVHAMYVATDGTVYTNSGWDEAGREVGIYKDGDVNGMAKDLHGWGRGGGAAITSNGKYIYVAMQQQPGGNPGEDYPPDGTNWYCVRRYNLSGDPVPFPGGRGYDKSMLIVSTSSAVTGLATVGSELYVSDYAANRIRVYDTETMNELRNWAFTRPGQIALDSVALATSGASGQGNLWIIQAKDANNTPKILHYSKTGKQLSEQITGVGEPTAIAVDNQGRLLVTDNGLRQQVLIYNITGKPTLVGTLGIEGGIYSGRRGEVGDLKLYGLTGVGTDAAGNIYVSNDGFNGSGADLRKFDANGALRWRLLGLQFLDNADADPDTDGVDVFTKNEHFVMDYSKGSGQEWTYKAYTVDRFRYPDDPRLHTTPTSPFVRRIGGKRFLYLTDQMAESLLIYRFDGEIAVPSAIFARNHSAWPANQPSVGSWMWRDKNGDGSIQSNEYENLGAEDGSIWGWEVDSKGDIWQASESGVIRHYRYQGLDAYGSPIYSSVSSENIPMPAPFNKLTRLKYFPDTDVMYLGGYTSDRPHTGGEWGIVGTEIVRYDNWSQRRKVRWRIPLPYEPTDAHTILKTMDVAGDKIFAATVKTAEVYVYDAATGAFVTKLAPGTEVASETGWVDTPYGLRAYRRSNGEYLVFVEEVWKAKVIMYRLASTK
jgi:hypothetical protein